MNAPAPASAHPFADSGKAAATPITNLPAIGEPLDGGFFAGLIRSAGQIVALIVAPKAEGETTGEWGKYESISATSYDDGAANTDAMAAAGSPIAKQVKSLVIAGRADWYIPAQDELEVIYRNLKPTAETNTIRARSGINLSAIEPTRPYTPELPAQTTAPAFATGGAEAFEDAWYWSSTQYSANNAWDQDFSSGTQNYNDKGYVGRVRAVRRLSVIQ
jgi:hypothetical protein